ncbi:hypothetical protein JL107_15050 [Nakamurella flavida]|uniref:Uncharacterized protein n=1 Tax=Nakamurella flavida TaxID=363630 RepID=A0A938YN45_9ACTN|nr:hypothetical protein [Nakamurella flavida]MDP9779320.1 hypothetical protein [Nakamurella flavida]
MGDATWIAPVGGPVPTPPVPRSAVAPAGLPPLTGITLELLRLRRTVRLQQALGPLLLVLIGLLQPVTVIDVPGGLPLSRTLWVTVRYFTRDGDAIGPVSGSVAWGTGLATAGSIAVLAAAVIVLCTWWNELRAAPGRMLTLFVRAAAVAMAAGAAALIVGQGLLGRDGMPGSAWQVGTLLFAAAGIWLVLGATAGPGLRLLR